MLRVSVCAFERRGASVLLHYTFPHISSYSKQMTRENVVFRVW